MGLPWIQARQISDSVPAPPPIEITKSPASTVRMLRACPRSVGMTTLHQGFASSIRRDGMMPTTVPPALRAPRLAPSITPPRPPVTSVMPNRPNSPPTCSAASTTTEAGAESPITVACAVRRVTSVIDLSLGLRAGRCRFTAETRSVQRIGGSAATPESQRWSWRRSACRYGSSHPVA